MAQLLGGIEPEEFLREYWQKRPLLVRDAWPGFTPPLGPDEVAGLACEDGVESRLVMAEAEPPWQLIEGPFEAERLSALPERGWSLLVQDVDKHVPEVSDLLTAFDFLPRWRVDDVMVSVAGPGGSVGPHLDSYDVFLLQAFGTRRWQIAETGFDPESLVPGTDLRVLQEFSPEQEWLLGPGDLLYLPPGVAHFGVAEELCSTYSVGLRAPTDQDLWLAFAQRQLESVGAGQYSDPGLKLGATGEIAADALAQLRARLVGALNPAIIDQFMGCYLTEPKDPTWLPDEGEQVSEGELRGLLAGGADLHWHPAIRHSFAVTEGGVDLFVAGERFPLPAGSRASVRQLTARRTGELVGASPELLRVVVELIGRGWVQLNRR